MEFQGTVRQHQAVLVLDEQPLAGDHLAVIGCLVGYLDLRQFGVRLMAISLKTCAE